MDDAHIYEDSPVDKLLLRCETIWRNLPKPEIVPDEEEKMGTQWMIQHANMVHMYNGYNVRAGLMLIPTRCADCRREDVVMR